MLLGSDPLSDIIFSAPLGSGFVYFVKKYLMTEVNTEQQPPQSFKKFLLSFLSMSIPSQGL